MIRKLLGVSCMKRKALNWPRKIYLLKHKWYKVWGKEGPCSRCKVQQEPHGSLAGEHCDHIPVNGSMLVPWNSSKLTCLYVWGVYLNKMKAVMLLGGNLARESGVWAQASLSVPGGLDHSLHFPPLGPWSHCLVWPQAGTGFFAFFRACTGPTHS